MILIGTGSEVSLALSAAQQLAQRGANLRVVSMPSWDLFEKQTKKYRQEVLPPACKKRIAIEAAMNFAWERYVGNTGVVIGMTSFGASGPFKDLAKKFGFTLENVVQTAEKMLAR